MRVIRHVLVLAAFGCLVLGSVRAGAGSTEERQLYRSAIAAAKGSDPMGALRQASQAKDPLLRKLVTWMALTRGTSGAGFAEIAEFITPNPEWPGQVSLR